MLRDVKIKKIQVLLGIKEYTSAKTVLDILDPRVEEANILSDMNEIHHHLLKKRNI